jgi:hypothetical protein
MLTIVKSLFTHINGNISYGVRRAEVSYSGWLMAVTLTLVLALAYRANAQAQNSCPPGFNDTPALSTHLNQADIASGKLTFGEIFRFGQQIFTTNFNKCDGAGRPARDAAAGAHGVGNERPIDPLSRPRFTMLSGPDSTSCASCHNEPEVGGAGSFNTNLREQAVDCDPVAGVFFNLSLFGTGSNQRPCRPPVGTPTSTGGGFNNVFNERGSLGLFGSGAIELLSREMTDDLQDLQAQAIEEAQAEGHDVTVELETKGVHFGTLTAHPDGTVDTSEVEGVSPDLVVRQVGRKGQNKSNRHFSIQAFNRHHGMQPVEALEQLDPGDPHPDDPDQDGVTDELTVGDITAVMVFMAGLPIPQRVNLPQPKKGEAAHGEQLFSQVGCAECHIPALPLNDTVFCEPNPRNNDGDFRDTSQQYCFDLKQTSGLHGNMVFAYTDLKRHTICDRTRDYDPETNHFCDDVPISTTPATDQTGPGDSGNTDRPPYDQFLTAKLWDVGNSGPWGHRNDLDTIYEAIIAHGGEAADSVDAYEALSDADQRAVVTFLKTLVMPIMLNNPFPQEAGTPTAPNPGGGAPPKKK